MNDKCSLLTITVDTNMTVEIPLCKVKFEPFQLRFHKNMFLAFAFKQKHMRFKSKILLI